MKEFKYILLLLLFTATVEGFAQDKEANKYPFPKGSLPDSVKYVDRFASFPGGFGAYEAFIIQTSKYPGKGADSLIRGIVKLYVNVDSLGNMSLIEVKESPYPELAAEAERLIKLMPRWEPCMLEDNPVSCRTNLNMSFFPEEYWEKQRR